jgi:Predicted integral membrane protein
MTNNNNPIKTNAELRFTARNQLKGQWGITILICVVFVIISGLPNAIPYAGSVISIVLTGPLTLGIISCFIKLIRKESFKFENLFDGFKNFTSSFILQILVTLFVFLWALLLVIPGIIAGYRYSMSFYILYDNPKLGAMEALDLSKEIMVGNKWRLFCLHLSFIGWALLSTLTLGIGFLWLIPYINTSVANFYESVKKPISNSYES